MKQQPLMARIRGKDFGTSLSLEYSADSTKTASFFVYQESFSYLRAGSGAAYAVAVTLLSGMLITVYVVVLRKREHAS